MNHDDDDGWLWLALAGWPFSFLKCRFEFKKPLKKKEKGNDNQLFGFFFQTKRTLTSKKKSLSTST